MDASFKYEEVVTPLVKQYCVKCHGTKKAKGDINLEDLLKSELIADHFKSWELLMNMVELADMPPDDEENQPTESERENLVTSVKELLEYTIRENAGDPGEIVLRRLTSAEYAYTIQDLTGLDLDLEKTFVGEAVGGEGFSNVGSVQFMQDAILERYLAAAKTVAAHAIIGAGPLKFYQDPGKSGQELYAINRINQIYQQNGFRSGAGEGAEAYGIENYPKAFYAAWRYLHQNTLNLGVVSLVDLAKEESISPKFLNHIWKVLNAPSPSFPTDQIVSIWKELPKPNLEARPSMEFTVREACSGIYDKMLNWQKTLAASTIDDEEYAILTETSFYPQGAHPFSVQLNKSGTDTIEFEIYVRGVSGSDDLKPAIIWMNPRIELHNEGEYIGGHPLNQYADQDTIDRLNFGKGLGGEDIRRKYFATSGSTKLSIKIPNPENANSVTFEVTPTLDVNNGDDCMVRIEISDGLRARTENVASTGFASALLTNPDSPHLDQWTTGVREFALNLPQVSHREAAPSDRDWIPEPFDSAYNKPERNYYHTAVKYHRDDRFLTETILNDTTKLKLDHAWTDLLTSFDFHNTIFRFVNNKYQLQSPVSTVEEIDPIWMNQLSGKEHERVSHLYTNYNHHLAKLEAAETGHLEEALQFAEKAWRRPLANTDRNRLGNFYNTLRTEKALSHENAVRSLLARILVSPEFLYRIETPSVNEGIMMLSNYELASRLSYFLWSSRPDEELLRAARAGELSVPENLAQQARRMLTDRKARRFATEFFGQWFGFYRFDDFTGIDTIHFSEFTDKLKASLYDESVSFFEYIVAEDRPVDEILFADYTFLDQKLADHYGIPFTVDDNSVGKTKLIQGTRQYNRGGLLRQGAILATTSAPLRTSAVKRGDWILRRILNTPTPSPPADAGSLPSGEIVPDGKSVRERLVAHRKDPSCMNCHTKIDPLGFALENFNPIGKWRDAYLDGGAIETTGVLNDGTEISTMDDLFAYLRQEKNTFYRNICEKLLGYALGRSENLSDRLLIDKMMQILDNDPRFSTLVTEIVTSKQFRYKRSQGVESAKYPKAENTDSKI